jgi:potassium efflux system protein
MRSGLEGLPSQMTAASDALLHDRQVRDETLRRSRSTRRKIQVGGLTEGMGLLLRREFEWTRSPESLASSSESRKEQLSKAQLFQITLQEERETVGDLATKHEELMMALGQQATGTDLVQLASLAKELLNSQRALHDSLIEELGTLIGTLIEHERVHEELLEATVSYRSYIEERILWVRSTVGGLVPRPKDFVGGISWLTSRAQWREAFDKSLTTVSHSPGSESLLLIVVLGLFVLRRRIRRRILSITDLIRSYRTDCYALTSQALFLTLLLALPLPLLLWTLGHILASPADQLEVARSVGVGLRGIAFSYFALEFLRQGVREKHIGGPHFRWTSSSMAALVTELRWFIPIFLTLELLTKTFDLQETPAFSDSVGRLAFILQLGSVAVVIYRLFRPSGKILSGYFERTSGLLEKTYRLWFVPAVGLPLALSGMALLGYYYSALQFQSRLRDSIGLALALLLVNALMLRWLYIARRRLAVEQARQRSQAKAQALDAGEAASSSRETSKSPLDEESVDIPAVDIQTRKLIRSGITVATLLGLFFIWAGAFPALRALDNVQLWPKVQILDSEEQAVEDAVASANGAGSSASGGAALSVPASAAGNPATALVAETATSSSSETAAAPSHLPEIITLADLIVALVVLSLTVVATKNAPGVLEITILQRLPLDSGARYALATLFRYLIVFMGLSFGFGALGIGWSKIQWLAAALTFGLAFGLQEIFANFVSGIIILLERPVRVGDIVTVGDIEGRVTKLRMRATTILDWNRRELLVPNKEFITGNVINWTLSDPVTRIVIPVGIAYGSDTRLAHKLLLKAARDCALVLSDPAPMAIFRSFGESSLDFELRVFLSDRDMWPEVTDQMHVGIDDEFRAAGIEISFPQRDLHIRTAPGLRGVIGAVDSGADD